jgi:fucose permease
MTAQTSSRRLMWAGFLGIFVWGSIAGLLGAILPGLRERAGISLGQSGGMFVALSTGLVLASLTAGFLLDRFGKKAVLCSAIGMVVAALLLFEFVNLYPAMLVLAFVMGAGGSAVVTAAHALISDLNPEHRAASLNLLDFFFGVGAFVTPFAIVPLQQRGGVTAVLFALAALSAAILVYVLTVRFPQPTTHTHFSWSGARDVLASPLFWVPALLVFLYVGTEQSIWDWQVTYFMRQMAMDNVSAARVLSIFPIAIMIGRLVNNRVLLRASPVPVLIVSALGATACFAVTMTATSAPVAAAGLLTAGLFMASIFPTALGVVSGRFADHSGTAMGLAITAGWLGSMIISPSLGFVAQRTTFTTAYLVVVGSATAMVVMAFLLGRQAGRLRGRAGVPSRTPLNV